jgi:hypothetical protein
MNMSAIRVLLSTRIQAEIERRKSVLESYSIDPEADGCELRCLEAQIDGLTVALQIIERALQVEWRDALCRR